MCYTASVILRSLSARRAWIEITAETAGVNLVNVALRKESVDRNETVCFAGNRGGVALRKESVDRNLLMWYQSNTTIVALRKESVDRNKVAVISSVPSICRSPQGERG